MNKIFFSFLGVFFFLSPGNFVSAEPPNEIPQEVAEKVEKAFLNQAEITKQLLEVKQELDVVKIRASMRLGKKKK